MATDINEFTWGAHRVLMNDEAVRTLNDWHAYDTWARTALGQPDEPWTGDMAEEGLTAADAKGECFGILNDEPRPCAYSFMARVWFEAASKAETYRLLTKADRPAPPPADLTPCAIDVPLERAIARHAAGGIQIGLRLP